MDETSVKENPFNTLAVAFIVQACSGTPYWFPAITPGIATALKLNGAQETAIIAAASSGSVLGLIGGLFQQRYGSRVAASVGAFGLFLSYMTLAVLTALGEAFNSAFLFLLILAIVTVIVTCSYTLYSSTIAASVSLFPIQYRGRIVGLCITMYGGSAGIFSAIQAVFFPTLSNISANMAFVSLCCLAAACVIYSVFPKLVDYDTESISMGDEEEMPLNQTATPWHSHISSRLIRAYRVALAFLASLQLAAVCNVLNLPYEAKFAAMGCVLVSIFSMLILPATSGLRILVQAHDGGNEDAPSTAREPSLWTALTDVRGLYLELGFVLLVGGSGMFLLVQLKHIIESLHYGPHALWADIPINDVVRSLVTLFSAFNVTGRLVTGVVLDRGDTIVDRMTWAYALLRADIVLMAISLFALTISLELVVLLGVIGIGFAYGAWFSASPTLTTFWFGVRSFPRNFAVYGGCGLISSLSLNSTVPAWFRNMFGTWYNAGGRGAPHMVCAGIWCRAPTLVMIASTLVVMYFVGGFLQPLIRRKAQIVTY